MGGTLEVDLVNGFTLTAGQSFDILDWLGSPSGAFSSLNLPALTGLVWNTSQLYTAGVLSVALPGDFNFDRAVNAADYVVWRKGLGTIYTQADYGVWRAHFGQTVGGGSGVSASAAVPEPATLALLIPPATGWCLRRRRTA